LAEGERLLDRSVIRGPVGAEEKLSYGHWAGTRRPPGKMAEKRAQQEREHAKRLDAEPAGAVAGYGMS